jgi:hypothetical protein
MSQKHIFIGYDDRESEAAQVLAHSIERLASEPVKVHMLQHKPLRDKALFSRTWVTHATGQTYDERDGRPFSTQFSHSRFLVPELCRRHGVTGWALFMDCDMLFVADPCALWKQLDNNKALACVKHQAASIPESTKMDGMKQQGYGKKLWSAFLAFNMDHPFNKDLTVDRVNFMPGGWLHGLSWVPESDIQALDEGWQWCVGMSPTHDKFTKSSLYNIHWTLGGPWMPGFEDVMYAAEWRKEQKLWLESRLRSLQAGDPEVGTSTPADLSIPSWPISRPAQSL